MEGTSESLTARLASLRVEASNAFEAYAETAQSCEQAAEESRKDYQELLNRHRVLQQELKDLKNAQRVHSGERVSDSYVIVLIDAHSHQFRDDLLGENTNGGSRTVKLLKDAIERYVAKVCPYQPACRIVGRVYANLKSLGVNDKGLRALAGFAAGFSREDSYFDFVDVGDDQIVKSKIADVFKISVKDPQCQHVLLGACRDAKYLTALQMHSLFDDKVSYIKGAFIDTGIERLRIKNVSFPQVFRADIQKHSAVSVPKGIPAKILESGACLDFHKDGCFRKDCKYKHTIAWTASSKASTSSSRSDKQSYTPTSPIGLPKFSVEGMVPVNAAGQRLDIYMSPPSDAQWAKYIARFKTKKLCNAFHLQGACSNASCEFDHSPIDESIREVLKYAAKNRPCNCSRYGVCRRVDCVKGHVCQNPACLDAERKTKGCFIARNLHGINHKLHKWVRPTDIKRDTASDAGESIVDVAESSADEAESSVDGGEEDDTMRSSSGVVYDLIDFSDPKPAC